MKTYLITYELKTNRYNYQNLFDAIRSYTAWGRINESTWIIKTSQSALEIRNFLNNYLDYNDSIFVIITNKEAAWNNVMASNDWLKNNL